MGHQHSRHEPQLDPSMCDGHGFCAELLPEIIGLDEWEFPVLAGGGLKVRVPHELAGEARRTVADCPLGALRIVNVG